MQEEPSGNSLATRIGRILLVICACALIIGTACLLISNLVMGNPVDAFEAVYLLVLAVIIPGLMLFVIYHPGIPLISKPVCIAGGFVTLGTAFIYLFTLLASPFISIDDDSPLTILLLVLLVISNLAIGVYGAVIAYKWHAERLTQYAGDHDMQKHEEKEQNLKQKIMTLLYVGVYLAYLCIILIPRWRTGHEMKYLYYSLAYVVGGICSIVGMVIIAKAKNKIVPLILSFVGTIIVFIIIFLSFFDSKQIVISISASFKYDFTGNEP